MAPKPRLQEYPPEQVTDPKKDQDHDRNDQGHQTDHGKEAGLVIAGGVGARGRAIARLGGRAVVWLPSHAVPRLSGRAKAISGWLTIHGAVFRESMLVAPRTV